MKTFERWAVLDRDKKLLNHSLGFTEPDSWDTWDYWMSGRRTATPDDIARYQSYGYRAVCVTVTVEGGE